MGMFDDFKDKATDAASEHSDKVDEGLDAAADKANDASGGKFEDQIQSGKESVGDYLGGEGDSSDDES